MNQYEITPLSWPARLGLAVIFILALLAAIALSAFFFVFFLVMALLGSVWLWWQRRRLYRQARQGKADIIEVEYEVLEDRYVRNSKKDDPEQPRS